MQLEFSLLPNDQVEHAFQVLQSVGRHLETQGKRQRITKTRFEDYKSWQFENANFIVSKQDQIIGIATLRREPLTEWPGFADLGDVLMLRALAVDPEYQGRGVGAFTIREIIRTAKAASDPATSDATTDAIYLDCVSELLPVYYTTFDFEPVARQLKSYVDEDDPYDITLMRRSLRF